MYSKLNIIDLLELNIIKLHLTNSNKCKTFSDVKF